MRPLAVQHCIKLGFEIHHCQDHGHEVYVSADALRLRQVMINLVSNAIKYNVEGGRTDIRCLVAGGKVEVVVEDTGIGIPQHQQAEIFMPFTRVHNECNVEGSGIGLAVTLKNLELMGSQIHIDSEPGRGSRFWFQLDLAEAPVIEAGLYDQKPVLPESPLDIRVLYIEDNPIGMRLMEEVMSTLPGVTFYGASSGEQGYRLAQEMLPDLIFMDINLPDISGIDVLQRLQAQPESRTIPVIALSASALDEDVQRGLEAGFLHYLRKPCEPDEIIRLVTELAASSTAQDSLSLSN